MIFWSSRLKIMHLSFHTLIGSLSISLFFVRKGERTMKKTTTTITKTSRTSARRRTTRSTTTTVDDGNDAGETTTTTKKTSSKSSSSTASTLMDAFLRRIDDEETTQPSSSNMSLVALASRIEKECFPRLEDKDIPTTNDDDVGDGVVRARKHRLGHDDARFHRRINSFCVFHHLFFF